MGEKRSGYKEGYYLMKNENLGLRLILVLGFWSFEVGVITPRLPVMSKTESLGYQVWVLTKALTMIKSDMKVNTINTSKMHVHQVHVNLKLFFI